MVYSEIGEEVKMTSDKMNNVEEIDLLKLAKALWTKAWAIVLCAMILGAGAFYLTYRKMYTSYRSSAMLYVNNNSLSLGSAKLSISSGDIKAVNNLMETYSVILLSRNTLGDIIEETQLPFTYEQLARMIKTETVGDTAIFKITVTADNPEMSAHIANSILAVLPTKISTVVEGSSAQIVEYAVPGVAVVNGRPVRNAAVGAVLGAVLASAVIIFMYMMDTKIRNEEFLLDTYKDIPILSSIPDLNAGSKGGYYGYRKAYASGSKKDKQLVQKGSGKPVATASAGSKDSQKSSSERNVRPGNENK